MKLRDKSRVGRSLGPGGAHGLPSLSAVSGQPERQMSAAASLAGGVPPQPTAVRTACPCGLLQALPARLPGPSPSLRPSPTGVRPVESLSEALCGRCLHPPSLQLGREQSSEHGNGAEDAGQDRTGSAAWPGPTLGCVLLLLQTSGPSPVNWGAGLQSGSKAGVPGPAPSASPGSLLAVQILKPPADLQDRRVGPSYLCLSKPSRCLRRAPCWRIAGLDYL